MSNRLAAWRGWAIALAVLLGIVVLAPLTFSTGIGAIEALAGHNDLTLNEGLQQTTAFVDATASEVAAGLPVSAAADNADPADVSHLRNTHSFDDQSRPLQYPGYDDCDSWKNIILDGWAATYRVEITLRNEQDAARLLNDTRRFWESLGYEVETVSSASLANGSAMFIPGYAFHVNAMQREASISGWTDCLPPAA